jgi:hypothetical protein
VFGSPQLADNGNSSNDNRMFFDKSKGAFRVGSVRGAQWDDTNVGLGSVAMGISVIASGQQAIAIGDESVASGHYSIAAGSLNQASGYSSRALGYGTRAIGGHSFAAGELSRAEGAYSVAFGDRSNATGHGSVAFGLVNHSTGRASFVNGGGSQANGNYSFGMGYYTIANGEYSTAFGFHARADGDGAASLGVNNYAQSYGEIALGVNNTITTPLSDTSFELSDRLFVIGNGEGWLPLDRSDALVMLKNGNTRLHGQLTIDADNVNGAGEPYTLPGQDGAANQVLTTDGNGNVSWNTPATITENDVDNFVSNNGYLTSEVDGSVTNEIQDLNLTGNILSITNNAAPTNIDLTPYQNVFETTNGVTSNENGNYATDDFVFGGPQLADNGNSTHDIRMFFDKSKGAFRAGWGTGDAWNDANVGSPSVALGYNVVASGSSSVSLGGGNIAAGPGSFAAGTGSNAMGSRAIAIGYNNSATNDYSVAIGRSNSATAESTLALGYFSQASSYRAVAIGALAEASGQSSMALNHGSEAIGDFAIAIGSSEAIGNNSKTFGQGVIAPSGFETVIGTWNSLYTPTSATLFNSNDRLFTIGNGSSVLSRGDALIILKNGNTTLHGELTFDADNVTGAGEPYTLPGQDGAANQVMMTDGNGNVSWNTPTTLTETDVDNFVSNNGYLTTEVDGSITNEIQDLNLTGNLLSITNNAAPTNIDLTPYQNVFETTNGVTSNENGSYTTDSFVIGSPSLDDDGDASHDTRMFFEKSTGAFRVGTVEDFEWNTTQRGINSIAMGNGNIARGNYSLSLGLDNLAHSASSVAIGTNNIAEGYNSIALGRNVSTTGLHSMALSFYSAARSFGETTMGMFATDYVPNAIQTFDLNDRLFTIGNGTADAARSNALVVYKNGDATLLGTLTDASDLRLKRNIKPLQNSLYSLSKLKGVHYQWNGRKPQDTVALQTGLIAQEVEKILPELVKTDEEGFKSVNYIGLVPHLIEAIKELKQENEILKSENQRQIAENAQRNQALEARIRLIENLLIHSEKTTNKLHSKK